MTRNRLRAKRTLSSTQISKLPKMEAIPILKNQWVLTWTLGKEQDFPYKTPTVVLTYVGEDRALSILRWSYGGGVAKSLVTYAQTATLLGQHGGWWAYAASPGGNRVCFAIAKPKTTKTEPEGDKRDPAYLFVSNWLDQNVKNEVSVIIGYPFNTISMPPPRSAPPSSQCTPKTTGHGSRTSPRHRVWSTPCARAPT